jgi:hypothetical protein
MLVRRRSQAALRGVAIRRRNGLRVLVAVTSVLMLIGAPVLVVLLASSETVAAPQIRPASADPLRPAAPFFRNAGDGVRPDGIGCSSAGAPVVVAVAHLDLFADGQRVTVPAGIGVLPTCRYWLSTSRADGVVLIASPERRAFTLGDLFDVWGAPLTRTRALSYTLAGGRTLRAYVDGRRVARDPRAIRLAPQREIVLVIGGSPPNIPSRFAFPRTP